MPQPATSNTQTLADGLVALSAACARNTPIEVVRRGRGDQEPSAKGRLLELRKDALVIEKVRVIGRTARFPPGSVIDCYFTYGGALLQFRSRIVDAGQTVQLNDHVMLPAMSVAMPEQIESGQRRQMFRVSLGTLDAPPKVEVWYERDIFAQHERLLAQQNEPAPSPPAKDAPAATQSPPAEPPAPITRLTALDTLKPSVTGTVADGSDTGVGLMLPGAKYTRFRIFDRLWVRIALPGDDNPIVFPVEIRHARDIPDRGARVGVMFIEDEKLLPGYISKVRRMVAYLNDVQRDRRKKQENRTTRNTE